MQEPKHILQSKVFWTNLLAPIFLWLAARYGIQLDAETQAEVVVAIMSLVNIGLRAVTHRPVRFNILNTGRPMT
jgi:uncharacterized membrane protein